MSLGERFSDILEINRETRMASYYWQDKRVQPVSDVICYIPGYYDARTDEYSKGYLILDVPGHEGEDGIYTQPKYQVWLMYDNVDNYFRGTGDKERYETRSCDLYHEIPKNVSKDPVSHIEFGEYLDFKEWQTHVAHETTRRCLRFLYTHNADDGMPKHKATKVYSIYYKNIKIGGCYGNRVGQEVIDKRYLKVGNDPGRPAFFYCTLQPCPDEMMAMMLSTAVNGEHYEPYHEWADGVDEAWYPTFDTLAELMEFYFEECK